MKKRILKTATLALAALLLGACSPKTSLLDLETWDLVWISDSSGWGVAQIYAEMVEEDTGIKVNLSDNWMGELAAGDVLHALQGTPSPSVTMNHNAELIREAEIVVVYGNPNASIDSKHPFDWQCHQPRFFANDCSTETFDTYIADLESIYALIFELRAGRPTIIRTYDAYNPYVSEWRDAGVFNECASCWRNYNASILQAAQSFNIPVATVFDAWNGSDFTQDPRERGYTKDGIHPNTSGAQVIAEALRALGYEPVDPSR